ncbi:MAG: protein-methionine-sulfoxide reductase catalytic subunit MsrP [Lysobacteraceae bacterium]|nr:MAG: protein-methionine-sulfoxide reductase catalytic subunit MsrP [Xanthomonadaceae bacterium]
MSYRYKQPKPSEITPESIYKRRRELLKAAGFGATLLPLSPSLMADSEEGPQGSAIKASKSPLSSDLEPNSWNDITTYNNFYEFGTGKGDPARNAHTLQAKPWTVTVSGEVDEPGQISLEDVMSTFPMEERIYRLRCVEAWSMVVPWVGFPLAELIKRFKPNSRAKYVAFKTLYDPQQMPGQRRAVLPWPYVEGLRLDEAMHPLTILATGIYGRELPNQNGAPLRLVVPWKYGFKSIKSIVSIELTEEQPPTSWNLAIPSEYGFYANVNPEVDHPRWSQASERVIGSGFSLFGNRRETDPFNGYAEQVASMYKGMDLSRHF